MQKEDNSLSTKEWRPLKAALLKWRERNLEKNKEIKEELNKTVSSVTTFILIILLITILSILVTIQLITRNIVSSLNIFQNGLLSFFAFSNKESSNVQLINLDGKDEFGIMAKVINENIKKLNEILLPIIEITPPPAIKGKYIKIKYVTQLPTKTPQFAFFCNLPQYVKDPYKRFIENQLRKEFDFEGVPIEVYFRKK